MRMTRQEFRNERFYNSTMVQVKKMMKLGLITEPEYWRINARMKEKYKPVSNGLVSENELLCAVSRA